MRPEPDFPLIVPVILAGGEGRRLRPLTAPTRPKPFLKLFSKYSLLQMTLRRGRDFSAPVIVCAGNFSGDAADEARDIGIHDFSIIAEPVQRGTAAAIAAAAFSLQGADPVMLVMPSDHVVGGQEIFEETARRAAEAAADSEGPVILGVRPGGPRDRYGYIRTRPGEGGVLALESFIEKPTPNVARKLCAAPGVFWNSGIFLCRARVLLRLLAVHAPDIFESAGHAVAGAAQDGAVLRPDMRRYAAIPAAAIDHALMERIEKAGVLPLETTWHDVGCWERIFALKFKSFSRFSGLSSSYGSRRSNPRRRDSF